MSAEEYAHRAARAYRAMQSHFRGRDGRYRRGPGLPEHLWPLARAFVATLDLAQVGLAGATTPELDLARAVSEMVQELERYWTADAELPAYASDPLGSRFGGDRYYDDNAWVGLGLVQLERMRSAPEGLGRDAASGTGPGSERPGALDGPACLDRAAALFRFAAAAWDTRSDVPSPGGVFWVEQGRGVGRRNHDRNTVSNAPNAELGLHLAALTGAGADSEYVRGARAMIAWVERSLADRPPAAERAAGGDPTDEPATEAPLYFDKLRGDGTIDRALWSYNQGSMIGARVLLARRDPAGAARDLAAAEASARRALGAYGKTLWGQPAAFNAIFFRNLLLLHEATSDEPLRERILAAARSYTDRLWRERRDERDLVSIGRRPTLLDQSALVQLCALLASGPAGWSRIA